MLFQKKVDGAIQSLRRRNGKEELPAEELYDPKREAEEEPLSEKIEKGDLLAMVVSALVIIIPVVLLVLLGIVGLTRLMLRV